MASSKDIRNQIHSVENTKKITKAMEMVAASKMRKAQDRMHASRPYSETIRKIASHVAAAHPDYIHPYMAERTGSKGVGYIVVTTDKGLCGGLNTNILRMVTHKMREDEQNGGKITAMAIGTKGLGYLNRIGARVVSHVTQLGDTPRIEQLIGPLKVLVDEYIDQKLDVVYLCYNKFINTMQQETVAEQILPLPKDALKVSSPGTPGPDYLYEPDAASVINELLQRYIEILVYQGITENNASEQSARMVAMKSASDNAGNLINDLGLVYNKTRQAAITTELTEIVSGAAAVSAEE